MNKNTLKITTGAMFIAIFAMMLLINRQTGMMFEELIMYLLPIPMVAYSANYGLKSGIPVTIAMGLISILFGTPTTIFYAVTEAVIGLIFGSCMYHKVDTTKTLVLVIVMSAVANVLNTIVFASLFGYNLTAEVAEMQNMINSVFTKYGTQLPEGLLSTDYLMRMLVISMIVLGIVQGYIVYTISLLILRRLRFQVQKPKSIYLFFPPKWTGYLAGFMMLSYIVSAAKTGMEGPLYTFCQTMGICGALYLQVFGYIATILMVKVYITRNSFIAMIIGVIGFLMASQVILFVGLIYIATDYHARLLQRMGMQ